MVPLVYAMFANSPLCDGRLNGYQSYRGHIWTDTDPDRCGTLEFVFRDDAGFEDYVDYALDVPMYFIYRNHEPQDLTRPPGLTFRQFMDRGWNGERATIEDWATHLTTIFTEVRLKKYVEVRTADSQPPALDAGAARAVQGPALRFRLHDGRLGPGQTLELRGAPGAHRRRAQARPGGARRPCQRCANSRSRR